MATTTIDSTTTSLEGRRTQKRAVNWRGIWGKVIATTVALILLFLFLVPLAYMVLTSLKSMDQMTEPGAPIYPAVPETWTDPETEKVYPVYIVPMENGRTEDLALVKKGRKQSEFIDPKDPAAGPIQWEGSWRALDRPWEWSPTWQNYVDAWTQINFGRLFLNTVAIAAIGIVGTLLSCIVVAYGFSRFRFPGRNALFTLLIATIFLPSAVTIVPTFAFFNLIGWVGTWLPLTVPHFFANAYNVFLLRQYFMTIPMEIDEAAAMDGASPLRILMSIIVPMSTPVIVAVALFHLVFAWNDFFAPLIYLSTKPDLQPIAVGLSRFNGIYGTNPPLIQAAALMASLLPIILFFMSQRVFMQGVVVTGVEK
ncbi:MAG: carbohydrate ABC transporter permease [Anaerolineales bacterium]|nr:carbohydrate ABC transporter permease [Anaerolineales bacterium]